MDLEAPAARRAMEWAEHLNARPPPQQQPHAALHQDHYESSDEELLGRNDDLLEDDNDTKKPAKKRKLHSTKDTTKLSKYDACNNLRAKSKGGPSTFGNKEHPLRTSQYGLIDGRSNAQACFEQKVQLLRDFKNEFGHLQVPDREEYRRLHGFLRTQRRFYRKQLQGEKVPLTEDRIALLDSLGEWITPSGDERWPTMLHELTRFYNVHGHCCISSIKEYDKDLHKFVGQQRRNFKLWIEKQEIEQAKKKKVASRGEEGDATEGDNGTEDVEDNNNSNGEQASKEKNSDGSGGEKDKDESGDKASASKDDNNSKEKEDGNQSDNKTDNDDDNQKPQKKKPAKTNKLDRISAYYDQEKHDTLCQFQCPYLESYDERQEFRIKNTNLFGHAWFTGYELFMEHRTQHPDDQCFAFHRGVVKWTPVQWWVKRQRQVYSVLENTKHMKMEGPVQRFFTELMEDYNLILDPKKIKAVEDDYYRKKREAKYQQKEEEKRAETPQYKLEVAQQEQADAKKKLEQAKQVLKQAQEDVKKVQAVYNQARKVVTNMTKKVDADPVGKLVQVRPRGGGKAQGTARILQVNERQVGNLPVLLFYDLEFVETRQTELFVDGIFVVLLDQKKKEPMATRRKTRASEAAWNNAPAGEAEGDDDEHLVI